ncbi:MAG: hypothetical protein EOO25_06060 [Comamonadaceae bacterium]|nr:MAG: hypothetical protein EOO25_06060 [Comamonadaceae bacterium]
MGLHSWRLAGVAALLGWFAGLAPIGAAVLPDNGALTASPTDAKQMRTSRSGTGHQLIVPYYTVQNGNATLLNVVNSDSRNGKAVKVRFRSADNADSVLDFQVFLSPGDVWTANISRGADGRALLTTTDKSCTLPAGVGAAGGSAFLTGRLPATLSAAEQATQTREGYVEIITMADISASARGADGNNLGSNPLFSAILQTDGIAPCTAATMARLAIDPASTAGTNGAYDLGFTAPSDGLYANWIIINVPKSGAASGRATALVAADASGQPARGNIVFSPQTAAAATAPNLATADPALRTIAGTGIGDVQNGGGGAYSAGTTPIIVAQQLDLPDLSTPYTRLGVYPPAYSDPVTHSNTVSAVLSAYEVVNEFLTDYTITAYTDWILTQPMRRYHVAIDMRQGAAAAPTRAFVTSAFYGLNTRMVNGRLCVNHNDIVFFDRERTESPDPVRIASGGIATPPPYVTSWPLCGAASVLVFNATNDPAALGAEVARIDFNTGAVSDGWAVLRSPGLSLLGLPLIGHSILRVTNPAVGPGIAANFGGALEHRYRTLLH